jgi:hypothetical protein
MSENMTWLRVLTEDPYAEHFECVAQELVYVCKKLERHCKTVLIWNHIRHGFCKVYTRTPTLYGPRWSPKSKEDKATYKGGRFPLKIHRIAAMTTINS